MPKADGSVVIQTSMDISKADKELDKLQRNIEKTEEKLNKATRGRNEAESAAILDEQQLKEENRRLDELKAKLAELREAAKGRHGDEGAKAQIPGLQDEIRIQQETVRALMNDYNKNNRAVERYESEIEEATEQLEKQKEEAGELVQQLNAANAPTARFRRRIQEDIGEGLEDASENADSFNNRIKKLVKNAFAFSLIAKALDVFKDYLGQVIEKNDEAQASLANLRGALLTLAQPLVNVIIPAFISLLNIITKVISAIARVVSWIFGTTVDKSAAAAKELNKEAEAISGVGEAAEEAAGSLAGFDEINTISTENNTGGGGSGGGGAATKAPDFSAVISGELDKITAIVGGALLALGAILAFSGINVPLGIALMAAGALTLAAVIAENWTAIRTALQGPIGEITALVSGALLALGAILAISGVNIPLGIALMAVGAAGLATVAAVNWNTIVEALRGPIGDIVTIVSTALLAVGAMLAISGANIPLGIGLIAVGALGLAAEAALNWDKVKNYISDNLNNMRLILSGAFLALGAILTFSGVNIPLGLSLLVAGAGTLVGVAVENWNAITSAMQGPLGVLTAIVSGALLVIGALLLFSGANIPLGLGLLVAGGIGLAASIIPNWNVIVEAVSGVWQGIKGILNNILSGIEGFINWVISGLNFLIDSLNVLGQVGGIIGLGFQIGYIGPVQLPRLAQGAVIPPNREFMAVLGDQKSGTNIEAPEDLIRKIVREETAGSNNSRPAEVKIYLDRKLLGSVLIDEINDRTIQAGRSVLKI